jgi:hypothetical protein
MFITGGTRWCSWLRHCATSRKVAGSIPDGVIGIFHWHNSSGRTMALWLTQPLIEMSTRNIFWGQWRPVRRADNLTTFKCRLSWNLGASSSWNPQVLSRPVMGLLYLNLYVQHYGNCDNKAFFFATSHGKVPCDGIVDIIRSVAKGASQQRSTQDHILTPRICMSRQKGMSIKFVFSIRQHMIMRGNKRR